MLVKVADWIADQYETLQRWVSERFDDDPRQADIVKNVIIVVCVVAVVTAVVTLISLIIAVLGAATAGAAQALTVSLERVADWHLTEVVTTPVRAYIIAHAAGLPAGAEAIWSAWTLSGAGMWLVCWLFRSWGARLAWVLYGAATVAMVYSASPAGGRMLATGIAVLYWAILSVFAFRGVGRRPAVHVHPGPDVLTALQQFRQQMTQRLDEEMEQVRDRLEHVEEAADELAARRTRPED
jgi:hypothetical protein